MPSSFIDSVPPIIKRIIEIHPRVVVDVGPGWGKYGLMCNEYLPDLTELIAIEVPEGRYRTQGCIYDWVHEGDVRKADIASIVKPHKPSNVLFLMIDVIEHMTIEEGQKVLKDILATGASVLVSTPKIFEEQHDDQNPYEMHVSLWTWEDFWCPGMVPVEKLDDSTIDSIIMTLVPEAQS